MTDPEDPAIYLAGRVRNELGLEDGRRPSFVALYNLARRRGVQVAWAPDLDVRGLYIYMERPQAVCVIVLRRWFDARALAHELYHHLVRDNSANGIVYTFPHWIDCPVEQAAERFAVCVMGEE